jgi:hypothetical protein
VNYIIPKNGNIQGAIDSAIKSGINTVYIPAGDYYLSKGLVCSKWDGEKFIQHTIKLIGDSTWWQSRGGTNLYFENTDGFGIGIQQGKGCEIKGLRIIGQFNPPSLKGYDWYKLGIDEFNDDSIISTRFNPYAGIVVDPYTNNGSNAGSTGVLLEDLILSNWDGCVVISPNGETQNAELIRGRKIQVANCRVGIANCHDQEKTNTFQHIGSWADVHTLFAKRWGSGTPGVYHISDVNIAGRVNQFIDHVEGGYFGSHFERIFCESLGKFGRLQSEKGASVSNSEIGFAYPESESGQWQQKCIEATGVTFRNCSIRYYGKNVPVTLSGRSHYDNCAFEVFPYIGSMYEMANAPTFSSHSPVYDAKNISPFGRKTLIESNNLDSLEITHEVDYSLPYCQMLLGVYKLTEVNRTVILPDSPLIKNGLAIVGDVTGFIGYAEDGKVNFVVKEFTEVAQRVWVIHPLVHHHFSGMVNGTRISNILGKMPQKGMCISSPSSNNGYAYSRWNYVTEVGKDWAECLYPFYEPKEEVFSTAKEVNVNVRHGNADLSKVKFILGDRFNGKKCIKSGDIKVAEFN